MEGGTLEPGAVRSNASSPGHSLGSLRQVTQPLCASVSAEEGENQGKDPRREAGAQLGSIQLQVARPVPLGSRAPVALARLSRESVARGGPGC